ncbi:hypothetical protein Q9Q94_03950 [Uliginosibacterium sp. 31-16]|uniref:hypothetical protein n=1 Tax=Uliginosibacterium sp. 31-16 TaxID=3068315 RepID=UPI00273DA035|nr:hypothetical protein [Uliginosibacterium sp. 31-16]MDP5238665.1 hypothetical protein [Uliginosibacterium sp. 31-16]
MGSYLQSVCRFIGADSGGECTGWVQALASVAAILFSLVIVLVQHWFDLRSAKLLARDETLRAFDKPALFIERACSLAERLPAADLASDVFREVLKVWSGGRADEIVAALRQFGVSDLPRAQLIVFVDQAIDLLEKCKILDEKLKIELQYDTTALDPEVISLAGKTRLRAVKLREEVSSLRRQILKGQA